MNFQIRDSEREIFFRPTGIALSIFKFSPVPDDDRILKIFLNGVKRAMNKPRRKVRERERKGGFSNMYLTLKHILNKSRRGEC